MAQNTAEVALGRPFGGLQGPPFWVLWGRLLIVWARGSASSQAVGVARRLAETTPVSNVSTKDARLERLLGFFGALLGFAVGPRQVAPAEYLSPP